MSWTTSTYVNFSFNYKGYYNQKKEKEDMNIKRIVSAIRNCPKGDTAVLNEWVAGDHDLSSDEKRLIITLVTKCFNGEDVLLPMGYLEENLQRKEKESLAKYTERGASYIIEAYMCSNYRGYLKHLLCSIIPGLRGEQYEPELIESTEEMHDSLSGETIHPGDLYYDVVSLTGDHQPLTDYSLESLKRADLVLRKTLGNDYFYNR